MTFTSILEKVRANKQIAVIFRSVKIMQKYIEVFCATLKIIYEIYLFNKSIEPHSIK